MASRAGKSKPTAEVHNLKTEIKAVISDVKAGDLDRNDAAVMIQGYRALRDFMELERRSGDSGAAGVMAMRFPQTGPSSPRGSVLTSIRGKSGCYAPTTRGYS
jgi:hypothetical protein